MASSVKNLNEHSEHGLLSIENKKVAVLVSEYHNDITEALFEGVKETLLEYKLPESALIKKYLPGAYELTLGAQYMAADRCPSARSTGSVASHLSRSRPRTLQRHN